MIHAFDRACFEAFARLLAQPDPPEMPRRTHIYSYDGESDRRATRLPALLMAWLQRRHLAVEIEEPLAPARRRAPKPLLARSGYGGLRLLPSEQRTKRPVDASWAVVRDAASVLVRRP